MNQELRQTQSLPRPRPASRRHSRRAFTLIELMMALLVTAIVFTGVSAMVYGAIREDSYLQTTNNGQAEVELAMRRISNNLRMAQTGSIVLGSSQLTTISQPDVAHSCPNGATVVYALMADPGHAGQNMLVETDPRYGTNNPLVHNVVTFTVALVSGTTDVYQVDLVTANLPVAERHFQVWNRN